MPRRLRPGLTGLRRSFAALLAALTMFAPGAPAFAADARPTAPPFTLETLSGEPVSLASHSGQVLLVNFWATWCPPCVAELPSMQALKEAFAGEAFEVLALNVGEEPDRVRAFLDDFDTPLEFPILMHAGGDVMRAWNVMAMPTSALVDKQGRIVLTVVGPRDWDSPDNRRLVRALLDE